MELNHLKYFYYVAKEGGYTHAAKILRVAQPAISKMVKNLEDDLGIKLFERTGRNVHMSVAGNDLFRRCQIIFEQVAEIDRFKTAGRKGTIEGVLNFGAAEPVAGHLVSPVTKLLLDEHPNVIPFISVGAADDLCNRLLARRLDFVLVFHAPELTRDLEIRQLYPTTFKLVVATDKARSKETCSRFIGSREVDDTSTKVFPTLIRLQKIYPKASIQMSTNSLTLHRQFVLDGLGVSILPEFMVAQDIAKKRLTCLLPKEKFEFNMKLICRRGELLSPVSQAYLELLRDTL